MRDAFHIGGVYVPAGQQKTIDISIGTFGNHMPSNLPVEVIHGRRTGPVLFVSAAVHGDEIIGIEIIRRLLSSSRLKHIKGTLVCIPVVNTLGFVNHSRYLPDRRDLNRSFPGAAKGSLAGQLAHVFMTEIVKRSDFGIDLHSAAVNRVNLPQIRFNPNCSITKDLALSFGAPVALEAPLRENSLRDAASKAGVSVLLYESGEALRFDEYSVRIGVRGILNVMAQLGMLSSPKHGKKPVASLLANRSKWLRSPVGGIFRGIKSTGDVVEKGDLLGFIADPFGENEEELVAETSGVIIGRSNMPITNPGDALFHTAIVKQSETAEEQLFSMEEEIDADPLFDEDEIL